NEEVDGFFYYLKYPVVDATGVGSTPSPAVLSGRGQGEGTADAQFVTVATTRPETMLGDTAVAINPKDPRAAGLRGKFVRLPIVGRVIPIIEDDYVVLPVANGGDPADPKAQFSSGFLKVTPAHDENDYKLGEKYKLPIINVMAADASISKDFGWTDFESTEANRTQEERELLKSILGMPRERAREAVVSYFKKSGLLEATKPYRHSVGHSYRSHVPIEPYLSDQWYVAVRKQIPSLPDDGLCEGTDLPKNSLAGLAWTALKKGLEFVPERYAKTYENWNANLRDWCISRQLWWGHRIPVWSKRVDFDDTNWADEIMFKGLDHLLDPNDAIYSPDEKWGAVSIVNSKTSSPVVGHQSFTGEVDIYVMPKNGVLQGGFSEYKQDPDVLDTWFSSALWPLSTLGWPENTRELSRWNPTSTLCTAREIITLWVSRMVMFNRYLMESAVGSQQSAANPNANRRPPTAHLPFNDVFIHAMIQDGHGQKMSKSLGNGVDPLDIIESHGADAMRFTLCHMTTQTQDLRLPVDCIDPNSGETITPKFFTNKDGYLVAAPIQDHKGKKFASSYGAITAEAPVELPVAKNTSSKFDLGRNFANKLWNASRFVLMQIQLPVASGQLPVDESTWTVIDRWILSRLARTVQACDEALKAYRFDLYAKACYDFVWRDFCDWYLEASKPAMRDEKRKASTARILATCLDYSLRLMHPAMPFITEKLWDALQSLDAPRGIDDRFPTPSKKSLAMLAPFPKFDERMDSLTSGGAERVVERLQEIIGATRELRNTLKVDQKKKLPITIQCADEIAHHLNNNKEFIETMAMVVLEEASSSAKEPAGAAKTTAAGATIFLAGVVDSATSEKRIGELKKTIASLEGRLSNESYIA
ncbi:MAG TPA: class I tRNA ligase family protein, partial [Tepidisphaeraceae bacterium]|nr:class I tRNA ligase family protein [Tepidisphaeraceae bacterium]